MLILVEGADGSGKTTLVNELNKHWPALRINKGCDRLADFYYNLTSMQEDIVLDRSFITDIVYRLALDDSETDGLSLPQINEILNYSIVIYCKTKTQYDDAMNRGEDNVTDLATSVKISKYYDAVMSFINTRTITPVITYDWHKDAVQEIVDSIKQILVD